MAVLELRKFGDPVLRRRAEPVHDFTSEIRAMIRDMIDTMYAEVGIGLAAPQVGISLRVIVIDEEKGRGPRVLVNPEVTDQGGRVVAEEGCLSIPGIFAAVERAEWLHVTARNEQGEPVSLEAHGLLARVIQHEIDHLDGVLFIDRLEPMVRDRIKRRIKKEGFPEDVPHRAFAL
jgi:peptide deformylase